MSKRAALTNLSGRLAQKATPAAAPAEPAAEREAKGGRRNRAPTQKDGRRGILVRVKPEAWRVLKILAVEEGLTLQELAEQALNDRLRKSSKPPIV